MDVKTQIRLLVSVRRGLLLILGEIEKVIEELNASQATNQGEPEP